MAAVLLQEFVGLLLGDVAVTSFRTIDQRNPRGQALLPEAGFVLVVLKAVRNIRGSGIYR